MSITSKSALAAELGITRGRVSQYVAAGLPVRSDGRLDREEAIQWVAKNYYMRFGGDDGARRAAVGARGLRRSRFATSPSGRRFFGQRLLVEGPCGGRGARSCGRSRLGHTLTTGSKNAYRAWQQARARKLQLPYI